MADTAIFKRSALAAALMGAMVVLAGCAAPPPRGVAEPFVLPVSSNWPGQNAGQGQLDAAVFDADWKRFFSDPQLQKIIAAALQNNRDVRVAVQKIQQAEALLRVRRADRLPTLNLVGSATRQPGVADSSGNGTVSTVLAAGVGISAYEFDFFGRIEGLTQAAQAEFLSTVEARKTVQIGLVAAVASTYLGLLADAELLQITEQTLRGRLATLELAQLRFDSGLDSALELRFAQVQVETARVAQAVQLRQRALSENALILLVGQAVPAAESAPMSLPISLPDLPAGLPADLLRRRPDILVAELALAAANANVDAARAAFFPRISLTSNLGSASESLSGLFASGSWGWTVAPQLLLPIFDSGRIAAGFDAATAAQGVATAQYDKSIQVAFREVADALASRSTLTAQLRATNAQASAETERLKLVDLRFNNGIASQLDQLDAQRSVFAVSQAVVQTRLALLQNQVALFKALGGGWREADLSAVP